MFSQMDLNLYSSISYDLFAFLKSYELWKIQDAIFYLTIDIT